MGRTKNNVEQVMDETMKTSGLNREEKEIWIDNPVVSRFLSTQIFILRSLVPL